MKKNDIIIVADGSTADFELTETALRRAGLRNRLLHFSSGRQLFDFLFAENEVPVHQAAGEYLLILDIAIPQADGLEILRKIRRHHCLKRLPVVVFTYVDDPSAVALCYSLGCSIYIVKPADRAGFERTVRSLGLFLSVVEVSRLWGAAAGDGGSTQ